MKILISGATGLIGTKLISQFLENGHSINILTRNVKNLKIDNPKITAFQWADIKTLPPKEAFNDVDTIINLMGENIGGKLWTKKQKEKIFNSRVVATQKIVEQINLLNLKNLSFISASAIGIYPVNMEKALSEVDFNGFGFLTELCQQWEMTLMKLPESCRQVIFRTGVVLSKDGGALKKMLLPFKMGLGGPIGNGEQIISWIHIDDIVSLYHEATINHTFSGVYNATAPNPVSNLEFTKALGIALNRPTFIPVPKFIIKLILGEMSTIILDSQKVIPLRLMSMGYRFKHHTINQAFKEIFKE